MIKMLNYCNFGWWPPGQDYTDISFLGLGVPFTPIPILSPIPSPSTSCLTIGNRKYPVSEYPENE